MDLMKSSSSVSVQMRRLRVKVIQVEQLWHTEQDMLSSLEHPFHPAEAHRIITQDNHSPA